MAIEPRMNADDVGRAVVYIANLPLDTNVLFMTVMANLMPFVGTRMSACRRRSDAGTPGATTPRRPARSPGSGSSLPRAVAAGMSAPTNAEDRLFDANRPLEVADQGVFSIPGRYVEVDRQTVMVGQMFVQYQIPKTRTRPYPVVMIHGGGQTASNFLGTPDGRRGWADDFRRQRLCRLRRRSVGTGPLGVFRRQLRQDAKALGRERGAALHRPGAQAALAAGQTAYPMARNGDAGGCGVRRLLCQPSRDHRRRGAHRADEP